MNIVVVDESTEFKGSFAYLRPKSKLMWWYRVESREEELADEMRDDGKEYNFEGSEFDYER